MKAAELLVNAMESRGAKNKDVAAVLHAKTSTFSKHITQNCLKAQELVDAAEYLGYKVVLVDTKDNTELELKSRSDSPRVRKQIDGKVYDTTRARFICRTGASDGWWLELYQNEDGEYFVAHYTHWDGVESFLSLCPKMYAERFIELNMD